MKTKIVSLILIIAMSFNATAQLDRSIQPKPGPAPKINLGVPGEFELRNGLKVLVVENHKLPRVSFNLTIDNPPVVEGENAGVSGILGSMLGNGTTNISKEVFNEEIDFLGARMSFGADGGFASALSKYSERILELMADAAMNPLLTQEEFAKEIEKAVEGLKTEEKDVSAIANRVGPALAYGKSHPFGEFTTGESLKNISLDNVRAVYQENFNPSRAYLVIVGDVDPVKIKKKVKKYFGKWDKGIDVTKTVPKPAPNAQYTQINFVDVPNEVQSNISLMNTIDMEMKSPDYHATLIANKILGGGFGSYLNMNLREEHGYTYGARSSFNTSKYSVSRFRAGASVRNMVTDSAIVQTLKEVNRIRTEDVSTKDLVNSKAKYMGDFVLALERPETIARYALNIKLNNLPKDFYETYLTKINAVSKEDVKRVANTYFKPENARMVVIGKGSDVLENLEKTGIPVKYFDKYANATEKPEFTKPIPDGVTAKSVMDAYIKAIGGKENVSKINTTLATADVTIQGAPFKPKAVVKAMAPNKESMEMSIEGMGTVMTQKFDGQSGYTEQQGKKIPMADKEVSAMKAKKSLFPELNYDAAELVLDSQISIDGKDVYKVKVTRDAQTTLRFYDANTGLLVRTERSKDIQGQSVTIINDLSEYSPVNGVLFPYVRKMATGPQVIILKINNVKVNEGVIDADFN
jgi:predicted Zn-dependent peptidase